VTFGYAFDFFLTFQVKGASRRSNETMGDLKYHLRPGTLGALGNSVPLYAVALTESNDLFSL
jgi:hypothetical protein